MKNLIIAPAGDNSLFKQWMKKSPNFDLVLLYYDDNIDIATSYTSYTPYVYTSKGEKYHLLKLFIQNNIDFILNYEYIWLPDDDVSINTESINKLFNLAKEHNLILTQPSMDGYVSHEITKPISGSLLRYTNFVEVLAPLFSLPTLLKVYNTFDINYSSWGYDYLWPHLLNYPQDKIAIIDDIIMTHTRPVGQNYSRFPRLPWDEMNDLLYSYNIIKQEINYSQIWKK
jgi:hypothetical protein